LFEDVHCFETLLKARHRVNAQKRCQSALTLWLRSVDSLEAKELSGTEDAALPFWSPDSRFVGFFAGGKLKKIDAFAGSLQILGDANGEGGTWNEDGTILFGQAVGGIMRISSDGKTIVYFSANTRRVLRKTSSGAGNEEIVIDRGADSAASPIPDDWSPDGQFLLYEDRKSGNTNSDLWVLPMSGDRKPMPYLQTEFYEGSAQISPDNRWVAYSSNESGRMEIYLRPFPNASGGKWQVSVGGGDFARWRKDGRELFYTANDSRVMAVDIGGTKEAAEVGVPRLLFQTRMRAVRITGIGYWYAYDVSGDGQRFLIAALPEQSAVADPLTVILNWTSTLKSK
jgi:WD40 repeat protein